MERGRLLRGDGFVGFVRVRVDPVTRRGRRESIDRAAPDAAAVEDTGVHQFLQVHLQRIASGGDTQCIGELVGGMAEWIAVRERRNDGRIGVFAKVHVPWL